MTLPNLLAGDPWGFWERLSRAERPFLGLDYDGTLAPFRVERMAAVPAEGVTDLLQAILAAGRTELAVISGRALDDLRQLIGDLPVTMVGSHGYERREPGGPSRRVTLPPELSERMARAAQLVRELGLALRLERKAASLAFHTRGLSPDEATAHEQQVWQLWSPLCVGERPDVRCTRFDGGVELRAVGIDKGTVLGDLLDQHRPGFAVYIGDDETDEDAFRVLTRRGGVGVKVGEGESAALARLPSCAEVVQLLRRWLRVRRGEAETE